MILAPLTVDTVSGIIVFGITRQTNFDTQRSPMGCRPSGESVVEDFEKSAVVLESVIG